MVSLDSIEQEPVLRSIPASYETVESEGRQMKQCWAKYLKIHTINPTLKKEYEPAEDYLPSIFSSIGLLSSMAINVLDNGLYCTYYRQAER